MFQEKTQLMITVTFFYWNKAVVVKVGDYASFMKDWITSKLFPFID